MSKLTDPDLKSNRMLSLGNVATFQWYFTGAQAFSGILRRSQSFNATEPIFPLISCLCSVNIAAGRLVVP